MITYTPQKDDLLKAVTAVQAELTPVTRDTRNDFLKYNYASLTSIMDTLKPLLREHNLAIIQVPTLDETESGRMVVVLETTIIWDSIQSLIFETRLPLAKADAQAFGSTVTYARRYAMLSFWDMVSEDDDGNATNSKYVANKKTEKENAQKPKLIKEINSLVEMVYPEEERASARETMIQWAAKKEGNKATKLADLSYDSLRGIITQLNKKGK